MAYYADDGKPVFANHDEIALYYTQIYKNDKIYIESEGLPDAKNGEKYQIIVGEKHSSPGEICSFRLDEIGISSNKIKIGDALVINEKTGESFIMNKEKALTMTKGIGTGIIIIIILALIIVIILSTTLLVYVGGQQAHLLLEDVKDMIYGGDVEYNCYDGTCSVKYPDGSSCLVEKDTNKIIKCSSVPFFGGIAGIGVIIGGVALLAICGVGVIVFGPKIMGFIKGKVGSETSVSSPSFSSLKKLEGVIK